MRPARTATLQPRSIAIIVIGGLLVVALLVTLVRLGTGGDEDPAAASGAPVELEHVHGLGVDPGDGQLYAGTHEGLIRLDDTGNATRVADRVQDFMGFTVVGPGHYLASGHPGPGQDGPPALGLIESTDAGETWQTLSLAGEADFHALEASAGRIYGSNAGQLLTSDDGVRWEARASLGLADVAVDPENPDGLLATTEQGLARSTDGGRSFSLLPGAPLLLLVSWPLDGQVSGVAPDGTVWQSSDGGTTWQQRGQVPGQPEAMTASEDTIFVAVTGGTVVRSDDGGVSFEAFVGSEE